MKKLVIEIFQITNGYLMEDHSNGEVVFLGEKLDIFNPAFAPENVHEARLTSLLVDSDFGNNKIAAIKAVRSYCADNNFDKYYGLLDAKKFVESVLYPDVPF